MTNSVYRKNLFEIPEDIIYLDGNSLGPLPKGVEEISKRVITDEWGKKLIKGWNEANWMTQPVSVGNSIASLLGAPANSIVVGDTLSIKLFQALAGAIDLNKNRKVILTDTGNFPSDLYIADGLIENIKGKKLLKRVKPDNLIPSITPEVAVVMLTQVDYRTGKMYDMEEITKIAHNNGSIIIWDLAHSAGAVPINLIQSHCDFAVGCTYKYLNGGPGSPAFIYVRPDLIKTCSPILRGWLGHTNPFDFSEEYKKSDTIEFMRVGTPPVVQMAILEKALDIWQNVDMAKFREISMELSELFIKKIKQKCPEMDLVSPINPKERGSQVSFRHKNGYAVIQALINENIIGDFRAPDIMRFGINPLYNNRNDIETTVNSLENIFKKEIWSQKKFLLKKQVT